MYGQNEAEKTVRESQQRIIACTWLISATDTYTYQQEQKNNVKPPTHHTFATPTVTKEATMPISAEMRVFDVGLGNNITWPKLPLNELPDYTFINNLDEEVFDLVGTKRSDKTGGTTGHI